MKLLQVTFNFFYEILLGCHHDRLTRPFTIEQQTYEVCLDCGKQIYYSADAMRPLSGREIRRLRTAQAGTLKVVSLGRRSVEKGSKAIA